ncbi:MAG: hypothetical protein Q7S43_02895 [bacterium]|nr:hypothetical protein [bacterium]MDO8496377.1 hypothetical protein [bacterium]
MDIENLHSKPESLLVGSLEELFNRLAGVKNEKGILWFGISGSWRKTNLEIEHDIRAVVKKIIERGDGIVSGGALNVDWFATDEALKHDPKAELIKIFLPVTLDLYAAHYRKRAMEGVITPEQAELLIAQLEKLQAANSAALIENKQNTVVNPTTYFERNTDVINASDALVGFQVNDSEGVGDTVDKALAQNKPVYLNKHIID